jgi:hypothetical protein
VPFCVNTVYMCALSIYVTLPYSFRLHVPACLRVCLRMPQVEKKAIAELDKSGASSSSSPSSKSKTEAVVKLLTSFHERVALSGTYGRTVIILFIVPVCCSTVRRSESGSVII